MKNESDSNNVSKKIKKDKKNRSVIDNLITPLSPSEVIPVDSKAPTPVINKTTVQETPKLDNSNLPPEFITLLNNKLLQTLSKEIREKKKSQKRAPELKDLQILERLVSEYLKSFVIIGYNLNGEKIVVGHATTQQDNDSLTEHLRQTFIRIMNSIE